MSGSKWKWDMQYLASQKSYIDEKFEGANASKLLERQIKALKLGYDFRNVLKNTNYKNQEFEDMENANSFYEETLKNNIPEVTVAIICKDEERCIKRCLDSIIKHYRNIIVVDTGSTDDTLKIVNTYEGVSIYVITWEDDFSQARNFAIEKCETEWIFFIDADEYLDRDYDHCKFIEFLAAINQSSESQYITLCPKIIDVNQHVSIGVKRIFKTKNIKYYGLVHEEPRYKKDISTDYICVDIVLHHDGYVQSVFEQKEKQKRNIWLLRKMMEKEPNEEKWVYFYLRDNEKNLNQDDVTSVITNYLLVDDKNEISIENLHIGEFTFSILDIIVRYKLNNYDVNDLEAYIICLDKMMPNNSNAFFYFKMLELVKIKMRLKEMLREALDYRSCSFESQYGMIHSEGAHLDFLLAVLLFENGNIEQSIQYFEIIKEKYENEEMKKYYFALIKRVIDGVTNLSDCNKN